jgi:hypothetical protein
MNTSWEAALSPKQRKTLRSLLENGDVKAAAAAANVSRTTVYSWLADPVFAKLLHEAEAEALQEISRQLALTGAAAVRTITALMEDSGAPPSIRLRAADMILSHLLRLKEMSDIEARLSDLERRAGGGKDHAPIYRF